MGKCRYFSYYSFERLQSEKATAQTYFKGIDHKKVHLLYSILGVTLISYTLNVLF